MAYIGQSLTEGTRRVYTYVATASQTTFNAVYGVGAVDVYQNGVLLAPSDYTASDGTTVVLGTGAAADDEITVVCHNTFSVADTLSASQGGTFTGDVTFDGAFTSKGIDDNATSTAMTLDSSGKLGINNSSPSYMIDVTAQSSVVPARLSAANGDAQMYLQYNTSTTGQFIGCNSSGTFQVQRGSDGTTMMSVSTGGYVTSSNAHQVGVQSTNLYNTGTGIGLFSDDAYSSCGSHLEIGTRASKGWSSVYLQRRWQSGEDNRFLSFNLDPYTGSATVVGEITHSGTGVTYNTTSDRRLKDNIEPIADGTEKLMAMNPVTHTWKADPEADAVHGFIAQEMMEIAPEAVSGDPDGEEMMSMDYGRITPVLVAALQDAHKKIEALEERLTELEAK